MIINTLYGIVTLLLIIAFVWLCIWVFTPKRHARFNEDAMIPFADEPQNEGSRSK